MKVSPLQNRVDHSPDLRTVVMSRAGYLWQDTTSSARETHTYDWGTLIEKIKKHGIRNSWTSTIAPTGTLSMIADTANGVEPVFALVYEKRVTVGRFFYADKVFESMLKENGLYSDEILTKIANDYGSVLWLTGDS